MKKYTVKFYIDNAEMVRGEIPHSEIQESEEVNAESSIEAIDLVIEHVKEQIIQNSDYVPEQEGTVINVMHESEVVQQYYNFTTEENI